MLPCHDCGRTLVHTDQCMYARGHYVDNYQRQKPIQIVREPIIIISEEQAKIFLAKFDMLKIASSMYGTTVNSMCNIIEGDYVVKSIQRAAGESDTNRNTSDRIYHSTD